MSSERSWRRVPILTLLVSLGGGPLSAINYLGDRGGTCFTLGGAGTHVITMTNGTTPGSTLLAIGMITGGAASAATPIQDSQANSWALAHTYTATNGVRLFIHESTIAPGKDHSAGDTVTLSYTGGSGQKSCTILSNWGGFAVASSADRKNGASGSSAAPSVATNGATIQPNEVMIGAFGFVASTGGFTYTAPFNPLSSVADGPHWMFPGYRILSATGNYSASATTMNVTSWGGLLVTFSGDNTIFEDGFENGTTSNWSTQVG